MTAAVIRKTRSPPRRQSTPSRNGRRGAAQRTTAVSMAWKPGSHAADTLAGPQAQIVSRDPGDALQQAKTAAPAAHRHLLVATCRSASGAGQTPRRPMSSVGAPPPPMMHRRGHLSCPPSWTGWAPPPPPSTAAAAAGSRRSGGTRVREVEVLGSRPGEERLGRKSFRAVSSIH